MTKAILLISLCIGLALKAKEIKQTHQDKLVISFISIGTGIDYKAKDQLLLIVKEFEIQYQIELAVSVKNWGREGEVDYVYDLTLLTKKQCKEFIQKTKKMLSGNDRIKITLNPVDEIENTLQK
jgi:hypothetical protein